MSNRHFSNSTQMFKTDNFDRKNRNEKFRNFKKEEEFEEELQADRQESLKMYRRNVLKKPVDTKSNLKVKTLECESDIADSFTDCFNISKNYSTDASEKTEFNFGNKNDAASHDLQKLVHYFLSQEDKNDEYQRNIYEKQGAIPKNKTHRNFDERNKSYIKKTDKKLGFSPNQTGKDQKTHAVFPNARQKRINSSTNQSKVSKTELLHCIFSNDFYNGDEILTINEEVCKEPFFYIVPENPLPNFFFSPGSYYITSKPPDSLHDDVVIFHPKKKVSGSVSEQKKSVLSLEETDTRIPMERKLFSVQNRFQNHLGKNTFEKKDSHLNIGPSDTKFNELFKNLETNCKLNKIYKKDLLNSDTSRAPKNTEYKFKDSDKTDRILTKTEEKSSMEGNEFEDASAFESDKKIAVKLGIFDFLHAEDEDNEEAEEGYERQETLNDIMQRLMSEFPDLDSSFASEVANKFLFDERGLQDFIDSERLKIKKQQQLERMILALPDSSYEKLVEKCEEFSGHEELVANCIEKEKVANKRTEILLEMQALFPDADPDFLEQKLTQLSDNMLDENNDEAINKLTNELFDNPTYPKITIDNVNAERKKLWQLYVENFDVKNFSIEVPNPKVFDEKNEHNANKELSMKFLKARYPYADDFFLEQKLRSLKYNLVKTCDALSADYQPVKLSENIFYNDDFNENFLKQIVYINRQEDIVNHLQVLAEMREIEVEEARVNNFFLSCPLCYDSEIVSSDAFTCPDGHIFCKDCIKSYVSAKFSDGVYEFACPEKCDAFFSYTALQEILPKSILSNIMKKQQAEEVLIAKVDGLESCPHCDFAYIPGFEEKIFRCQNPECLIETCRKCGENNHIPLLCEEVERQIDVEAKKKIEESMTKQLVRSCPTCLRKFVKLDGCNKMTCSCGTMMCYICRQKINDYSHFGQGLNNGEKCPLYSNNDTLHNKEVFKAGVKTKNEILQENPDIHILYDPTQDEYNN